MMTWLWIASLVIILVWPTSRYNDERKRAVRCKIIWIIVVWTTLALTGMTAPLRVSYNTGAAVGYRWATCDWVHTHQITEKEANDYSWCSSYRR